MSKETLTWKDVVANALRELGGQAHLSEINQKVKGHPKTKTNPTWQDTIRRVVRQYKIFEPVPPERSGIYRLIEAESTVPQTQTIASADAEINHSTAQGMLVVLGKIYGYETFAPTHDQTTRDFQNKKIGDLVTVKTCAGIVKGTNLVKVREIDVLWLDEDDDGLFPVFAFEVEHSTKVKNGMDRLLKIPQRFPTRYFILGPSEEEKKLFDKCIAQTPFRNFRNKFAFHFYSELENVYNVAVEHATKRDSFGLVERWRRL
jgi:hypothetical protein